MFVVFFFNDTATTEIYTLSLHDALPICGAHRDARRARRRGAVGVVQHLLHPGPRRRRGGRRGARHPGGAAGRDRKSTRLNSSHANISYAVFCLKKKRTTDTFTRMHLTTA